MSKSIVNNYNKKNEVFFEKKVTLEPSAQKLKARKQNMSTQKTQKKTL